MADGLWQVGLWLQGSNGPYLHDRFRSVFSVKLFIELSRSRPDFVGVVAPSDASSVDIDWIRAELSRAEWCSSDLEVLA
jgi:hypothetical protein